MKKLFTLGLYLLFTVGLQAQPCITVSSECNESTDYCVPYELSNGIYRIPFADGTDVEVSNDHFTHCPRGRIDMVGNNGNSIVAAADGWIRHIEDNHTQQCDCSETFCLNNYVWIEHPNGEWTKYTHMQTNSVPSSLDEGDWVAAGTLLGTEGQVGCASGIHLHFEVAQPVDTNTLVFDTDGGYIDGNWVKNVIPVFCDIIGNVFEEGEEYVAGPCSASCPASLTNVTTVLATGGYDVDVASSFILASGSTTFGGYSTGLYQAGDYITLGEGFGSLTNSTFTARIGDCNDFPERIFSENEGQSQSLLSQEQFSPVIYPDPADQSVNIEFEANTDEPVTLYITDVTGERKIELLNGSLLPAHKFNAQISTADFVSGLYICILKYGDKIVSEKFLVQH